MELKVGCTGWSYQGWVGPFYPKTLDNTNYLKHYSSVFETTEINSTFYRIPSLSITEKWYADTPSNFTFTAKLPKVITHEGRLKPGPYLDQFLNSIKAGQKMQYVITDYSRKTKRTSPLGMAKNKYDVKRYVELLTECCVTVTKPFGTEIV